MATLDPALGITPLDRSLPRLKKLLSPFTGIAHLRFHMMAQPSDPRMWHITCLAANSMPTIGSAVPKYSGGIHPMRERALAAALGEAAERYSLSYVPFESLRFAKASELGEPHADLRALHFFSDEQYNAGISYERFDENTPLQWAAAQDLRDGTRVWVPSAFCFLPDHRRSGEPRIVCGTSSGVACGATRDEAILGGLYELIERDAFMLMWYHALSLPVVECSASEEIADVNRSYYDLTGLDYRIVDLSGFMDVPSAMAVVRDRSGYIKLAIGAASARTMTDAIGKALREGFQTYAWARQMRFLKSDWEEPQDYATIRDFEDHVALHAFGDHAKESDFMDASSDIRPIASYAPLCGPSVREQIETLTARLHERGMDVYVIDVTAPELRDLGLHVMRAFSPQLCQIDSEHGQRFLGIPRNLSGAYAAGITAQPATIEGLNHFPHPFP